MSLITDSHGISVVSVNCSCLALPQIVISCTFNFTKVGFAGLYLVTARICVALHNKQ